MADGASEQFGKHEMKLLDIRNQFFRAYGNAIHEAKVNADSRAAQSDDAILRAAWSEMSGTNYGGAIKTLDRLSSFMRSKPSVAQMKKAANDAATEYRQNKLAVLSQYDRFSRPGAKDMMAREVVARKGSKRVELSGPNGNGQWVVTVMQEEKQVVPGEANDRFVDSKFYSTEAAARRAASKMLASRPGAKATFKVEDRFYFGKGRKERFDRYGYEKMDYDRLVRESWHLKDSAEYAVSLGQKDNELRQKMSALQKEFTRRGFTAAATVLDAALRKPFSRPGNPERFASISRPKQSVTSGPTGTWKKREVTVRGIKAWLVELYRGGILVGYLNQHPDTRQFHAFDGKNDQQIGVGSEAEMKRLVESL